MCNVCNVQGYYQKLNGLIKIREALLLLFQHAILFVAILLLGLEGQIKSTCLRRI